MAEKHHTVAPKTRRKRTPTSGCMNCGGPCEKDCIDNHGNHYKGCSNGCRFKSQAEIDAMTRPSTARELVTELRDHAERVELALDTSGYRDGARGVYELRLRMSEILVGLP